MGKRTDLVPWSQVNTIKCALLTITLLEPNVGISSYDDTTQGCAFRTRPMPTLLPDISIGFIVNTLLFESLESR